MFTLIYFNRSQHAFGFPGTFKSQSRLDYWFIPAECQDFVTDSSIIPSISTDHSAIILYLNFKKEKKIGNGYWKFNASLCSDMEYCEILKGEFPVWLTECNSFDPEFSSIWEYLKLKIRQNDTII